MRPIFRFCFCLLICLTLSADVPTTKLAVHVLTPGGKPLDRASVIIRFVAGREKLKLYKKIRTTWETKTDQEGFARIPSIPQGKIQIQVIAPHYQTFGDVFEIADQDKTIEIKMNPPQAQYTAH